MKREASDEVRRHRRLLGYAAAAAVLLVASLVYVAAVVPQVAYPTLTVDQLGVDGLTPKDRFDAQNARYGLQAGLRDTLVQAVSAFLAISGGVIAWLQYQGQREARRDDTHAKLFAEALTGLRTESLETRVGALFLLDRLAELSEAHRPASAQTMLSFVREKRRLAIDDLPDVVGADVQTALTLLTRRPADWYGIPRFTLSGLALRHVDLADARLDGVVVHGARREGADLSGTHLENAVLDRAHLQGADLTGTYLLDAHLVGARLDGATLDGTQLFGAEVTGWSLAGASYRDVAWPGELDEASADAAGAHPADLGVLPARASRPPRTSTSGTTRSGT